LCSQVVVRRMEMRGSDMAQEEFTERIGISQNSLATMEPGQVAGRSRDRSPRSEQLEKE
jgi:hypothetical protein